MSIAEDIANLTANFKDKKVKEVLSNMSIDELASVWSDIKTAHDAPDQDKDAQEKDFKEKSDIMHEVVTPEKLQSQINEYMENLANGTYSPADFTKISEFCTNFSDEFKNDDIKNKLNEMKKRIEEKRLNLENPLTLADEKLAENLNIQDLDSIVIEGDKEKISALEDKTQANGKTISFRGPEDKDLGKVSFDELGGADITFVNENNEPQHYQISADGKLTYLPDGQEPQTWTFDEIRANQQGLTKEAKQALKLAGAAKKVWNGYQKGELDNSVEKTVTVREGGNSTRVNEGNSATNNDKAPTKVDEGYEEEDPLAPTRINEEQSPEKGSEAIGDSGTKNDKPTPADEIYWKEEDIIEAMFREWFLKAANAATNWGVHQIEYAAAGIWNEFEAACNARRKQLQEEKNEKKPDKTKTVYGQIRDASESQMRPLADASKKKPQKEAIEAIKSGNIAEAVANNELLKNFDIYADTKTLLLQGAPETTVPFVMGAATMAAKFSDDYAQASILNEQMNNPDAFKGRDIRQVYAEKLQEAQLILKRQMLVYREKHPNENPAQAFFASIKLCTEDMKKAKEITLKDYNDEHYVENGKNPHKNEILEQYENIAARCKANEDQNEGTPHPQPEDEHGKDDNEPPSPQPEDEHGKDDNEPPSPQPEDEHGKNDNEPPSPQPEDEHGKDDNEPPSPQPEDEHGKDDNEPPSPQPEDEHGKDDNEPPSPQPENEHGKDDNEPPSPQPEDEHGKDDNEPTSLPEEANRRENADNDIDTHRNNMRQEEENLDAREQEVQKRRRAVERTKSNTHTGPETTHETENTTQQQPQATPPMRPRGREI